MKIIKQEGKTVEEAIRAALEKLGIERENADIKVIEEGSKGLLGLIGSKNAVVEVKEKVDHVKVGIEFLKELFLKLPLEANVEVVEEETNEEQIYYNIESKDLGIIIGHRGETLDAVQYLTSLVINKNTNSYYRVILDAEGYRERRKKTLERLARKLAEKAVSTGRKVMLEPMSPQERRIIHMYLKDDPRVITYSEGKEPFRKVLIEKKETLDNE
ncbi:MAG: protein jag [Halanaerobiaceae bacterium]|jgi:spoIIIJ-associated protein|nr:protein jag [Halanaerobiaceae bacterium]